MRVVATAPLVPYSWNRVCLAFVSWGYEFPLVYELSFVHLGGTNGKLYAASHTEIGRSGAAAPVILYY